MYARPGRAQWPKSVEGAADRRLMNHGSAGRRSSSIRSLNGGRSDKWQGTDRRQECISVPKMLGFLKINVTLPTGLKKAHPYVDRGNIGQ